MRFHVRDRVGVTDPAVSRHLGDVVGDHDPVEAGLLQDPRGLVHVEVPVVDESLHEMGQGLVHVPVVDLEDLALLAEMAQRVLHALAHQRSALEPAADAEAEPHVRAVGDFHGPVVSVVTAEDATRDTAEFRLGWIVRMDADPDARFLRDRRDFPDEMGEIVPDFVFTVRPTVGQRHPEHTPAPVAFLGFRQVESAGRRTAARRLPLRAPDPVPHVGIGRIGNAGPAEVAYVALVLFHLRVPVRQVEHDGVLVVHVAVPETVDLDAGFLVDLPPAHEIVVVGVFAVRPETDVFDAQLPGELQVLLRGVGRHLSRDFETGCYFHERHGRLLDESFRFVFGLVGYYIRRSPNCETIYRKGV